MSLFRLVALLGPVALFGWVALLAGHAAAADLVVLRPTGTYRDSLPVLQPHPGSEEIAVRLSVGFGATMLHLFRLEQAYLHQKDGRAMEPAYLLLSQEQGGFPRFGFYLDQVPKKDVGYVDLHQNSRIAGAFGTMDQIFPHELAHIIQRQLAGEPPPERTNQIHAIGVCTDPYTAFAEGFAEHFQVMACDDPGADPATRAVVREGIAQAAAERRFSRLRGELCARLAVCPRARMTFLLWFSQAEQALRYSAVKAKAFAFAPALPARLTRTADPYRAYLAENMLPGRPGTGRKPLGRLLATEGVVSAFFCRWEARPTFRNHVLDQGFYSFFSTSGSDVTPTENVYLKIFHTFYTKKPQDLAAFVRAYTEVFPEEEGAADSVWLDVMGEGVIDPPPRIRLANPGRRVGTSMFDQFRGLPRGLAFDLNSASASDLAGIPGVSPALVSRILAGAPHSTVEDLAEVPGISPAVLDQFRRMEEEWRRLQGEPGEESLSFRGLILPYLKRAALAWLAAAAVGGAAYFLVRRGCALPRALLHGAAASLVGLIAGWLFDAPVGLPAVIAVLVLFGVPAAARDLFSSRRLSRTASSSGSGPAATRILVAWAVAAVPSAILVAAW